MNTYTIGMRDPSSHQQRNIRADDTSGWLELRLLDAVERGRFRSQREAASDLGIALGLVNAYVKRCVRKGWLKVSEVPARRYAYYLTPQGFSEKARLSAQYLRSSMGFFRKARNDYGALLARAEMLGWKRVALVGMSDLTEIACLCALESEITIGAIIAPESRRATLLGVPVIADSRMVPNGCDGLVLTEIETPFTGQREYCAEGGAMLPMLVPRFLEHSLFTADARTNGDPS